MKTLYVVNSFNNNLGDFLIYDGFKNMITVLNKDIQINEIDIKDLNTFNFEKKSKVVIPGGPLISNSLKNANLDYESFFRKTLDHNIDLILFGVGLGVDFNYSVGLSEKNKQTLYKVSKKYPILCRDELTMEFLKKNNINSDLSGCPVINYEILDNPRIESTKILISDPGFRNINKLIYYLILCLKTVRYLSKNHEVEFLFNAGYLNKKNVSRKRYYCQIILRQYLKFKKIKILQSKDIIEKNVINQFNEHIGFRVHTHLLFTANNLNSTLIAEDLRGLGQIHLLNSYLQELPSSLSSVSKFIKKEKLLQSSKNVFSIKEKSFKALNEIIN